MTTFPGAPRLLRGGIVVLDPTTGVPRRVIALQYNPDTLTRTLQVQGVGGEAGDRLEALRLKGPPNETIKLDAELDTTDQLEFPGENAFVARTGLFSQLAALETIVYPLASDLLANEAEAQRGTFEIIPVEAPLTLFVWSKNRILPVRITEFSITEEAFDTALNPIRAKVSLGMRVLSVSDLPFNHRGAAVYLLAHQQKEGFADQSKSAALKTLGIDAIPGA